MGVSTTLQRPWFSKQLALVWVICPSFDLKLAKSPSRMLKQEGCQIYAQAQKIYNHLSFILRTPPLSETSRGWKIPENPNESFPFIAKNKKELIIALISGGEGYYSTFRSCAIRNHFPYCMEAKTVSEVPPFGYRYVALISALERWISTIDAP